jgi:hypothetical protein
MNNEKKKYPCPTAKQIFNLNSKKIFLLFKYLLKIKKTLGRPLLSFIDHEVKKIFLLYKKIEKT